MVSTPLDWADSSGLTMLFIAIVTGQRCAFAALGAVDEKLAHLVAIPGPSRAEGIIICGSHAEECWRMMLKVSDQLWPYGRIHT